MTGQFTSYKHRTNHELATACSMSLETVGAVSDTATVNLQDLAAYRAANAFWGPMRAPVDAPSKESVGLMPRKMKTYRTSLGFFELAIAAPSMKAALEAWGSKSNLFQQGFAKETDDPAIVAATSARPGVILKRAVGSNDIFTEHAALPRNLGERAAQQTPIKAMQAGKDQRPPKTDDRTTIAAAVAFEREEKRRERARQKKLAALEKQRKKRELAIANAEAAMEAAKRTHETKIQEIEDARSALDRQSQEEDARWEKQSAKLEAALSRARR